MKKPEQLPLDFSETATAVRAAPAVVATVVNLDAARMRKEKSSIGAVYDAIRESIKHIDVRRTSRDKSFADSSFR